MTIYQAGIYAALRIDTDEQNEAHRKVWAERYRAAWLRGEID